ncbi:MAG: NUDIX hydrolase [Minisyncoccia bacterium]
MKRVLVAESGQKPLIELDEISELTPIPSRSIIQMKIKATFQSKEGSKIFQTYYDEADLVGISDERDFDGSHAFCFLEDQLVLVHHPKDGWMPPGGSAEPGELYTETTEREVKEETNMKVLYQELIGYSIFERPDKIIKQTRVMCIVEKIGEFVSDPDGEIMEIMLIDPNDYKQYFDWGEAGDRIMQKAIELKEKWNKKPD